MRFADLLFTIYDLRLFVMSIFSRKKKIPIMDEPENIASQSNNEEAAEEIKFTDKRRINLDLLDAEGFAAPPEPELVEEDAAGAAYLAELEERMQLAEERAQAAERTLADIQSRFEQARHKMQVEIDQTRQRLNRAADERVQRSKGEFVAAMLPVADTLQLAIAAAEKGGTVETLLDGVRGTAQNFLTALLSAGVEPVSAVGQPFNPELHEAIDLVAVDEDQDGIVTAEYKRGYKMGERLLRPARVQVGRAG
jgi:molecular chaperone GrpE